MAEELGGLIHRSPRRMVAGLAVVGAALIANAIFSFILILGLFDRYVGRSWLTEMASVALIWGLPIAELAGTVLVMRGMDPSIPGGDGWRRYRKVYVLSTLGMIAWNVLTSVCFRVLTMTPYVPSERDISVIGRLMAAQSVVNWCGGTVGFAMMLWTLSALYKRGGPGVARSIVLLAGVMFVAISALGMVNVGVSACGWNDPMAPDRIRRELGWWAAPAVAYRVSVGTSLILGGMVLGLIRVVRPRQEGKGIGVRVAGAIQ